MKTLKNENMMYRKYNKNLLISEFAHSDVLDEQRNN